MFILYWAAFTAIRGHTWPHPQAQAIKQAVTPASASSLGVPNVSTGPSPTYLVKG